MEITRPSEQSVDTAADDDTKEYGTSLTNKNTQEQERLQNILKNFIDVQHRDGADRDGERNSFTERIDYEEQISKLVVYHSVLPDLPVDQLQAPDANSIKNMLSFPSASSSDSKSNDTDNSIKDVGKIVLTFDEL